LVCDLFLRERVKKGLGLFFGIFYAFDEIGDAFWFF
jgi:hypothetical protein